MVHQGSVVVNSQRQLEILLEEKVFEKHDVLLDVVVMCNWPGAWHNGKIGREHTLQNFLAGCLILPVNLAMQKSSLVRQILNSFHGVRRNGDDYRRVAGFVPSTCSHLRNDTCNENEALKPRSQHIPVKRLE